MSGPSDASLAAEAAWAAWRSRLIGAILVAVSISNVPALYEAVYGHHIVAPLWLKLTYGGLEVVLIAAAVATRWSYRARTLVWVAATFLIAIVGLARVGMAGSGRVFLLAIGPFVLILLGRRLGLLITALTALVLAVFVGLAYGGVIAGTLAVQHNPTDGGFWTFQSLCWLMAAMPGVVICERFLAHQEALLAAERGHVRKLEEEARVRMEAHRQLEAEMAERRRLEREVVDVGERERREVGHELHDGICQQLTGARIRCQVLETALSRGQVLDPAQILGIRELLDESLAQAYELSRGLKPIELDPSSLGPALHDLTRRVRQTQEVECGADVDEPHGIASGAVATQLFYIAQEAVNNAVKHAGATTIRVSLARRARGLELRVTDDGRGFGALPAERTGMGLRILRFRAGLIDGDLRVDSRPGEGTRVECLLPTKVGDARCAEVA